MDRIPTTATDHRVPIELASRLTAVLDRAVERKGYHHAILAVRSGDGTRRWSGAAGASGSDVRADSPFFIASVTKRFIVTLVLQAHERGELSLDDRMVDHLPPELTRGLHVLRGVDHVSAITIRHLVSHTSGLPDYWDKAKGGPSLYQQLARGQDRTWNLDDVIEMARQLPPRFAPQDLSAERQRAHYSDTGFQLLIAILERVTGRPFAALLSERIVEPLGMVSTWLPAGSPTAPPGPQAPICDGDRPLELDGIIRSANDLVSTTDDLLTFQAALLAGELFSDPATTQLLTERSNLLRNMMPIRYGLGTMRFRVGRLFVGGRRPVTLVGHTGATGTWLFHCPELDVHLAGTVDQAKGTRVPFQFGAAMLRAWCG